MRSSCHCQSVTICYGRAERRFKRVEWNRDYPGDFGLNLGQWVMTLVRDAVLRWADCGDGAVMALMCNWPCAFCRTPLTAENSTLRSRFVRLCTACWVLL